MSTFSQHREATKLLNATVRTITRLVYLAIPSATAHREEVSFLAETLASYLLEDGEDDFELDVEGLLGDAGLRLLLDEDPDDPESPWQTLVDTLTAMIDKDSREGKEFEEVGDGYSECDMCDRHMKLTFHHLVPKVRAAVISVLSSWPARFIFGELRS